MGCCGKSIKKYPSKLKMVSRLTLSVANVVAHVLSTGKIKAEDDIIAKRIGICQKCPHLDQTRCTACGCFVAIKAGVRSEKCPLKYW